MGSPFFDMNFLRDLQMYGRFGFGLPGFLRRRITVDEACELVKKGVAEREAFREALRTRTVETLLATRAMSPEQAEREADRQLEVEIEDEE